MDDINDNYPEITATPLNIKFLEATYLTLPLDNFMINDIDLVLKTFILSQKENV